MPKTTKSGSARKSELPSTLQKSSAKAQRTFAKVHDAAVKEYGEGERAHRVAYDALKHSYEKVGDHWEPKEEAGPSDPQAEQRPPNSRKSTKNTAQGVDANASKAHLVDVAKKVGIKGAGRMRKDDLVEEIRKANARATKRARS